MFVVTLRFAANKHQASTHMAAHNAWLRRGFDEGVFVLAGSIKPGAGGMILAHRESHEALMDRISADPFVTHAVVTAEIAEVTPGLTDERLAFLQEAS